MSTYTGSVDPVDYHQKAEELNQLFNGYLDKVSLEKGISKAEAFEQFKKMLQEAQEQSRTGSPSLDSDRVSTTPLPEAEDIGRVPRVATLSGKPRTSALEGLMAESRGVRYDPRLAVVDFSVLPERNALEAIDHIAKTLKAPQAKQVGGIHEFLFETPGAFQKFLKLNGSDPHAQNLQFEVFLKIMNIDLLNEHNTTWLSQVIDFAFSSVRFEWIQLQNEDIDPSLEEEMISYEMSIKSKDIASDLNTFERESPLQHEAWLKLRMEGSTTITLASSEQRKATQRWCKADKKMQDKAKSVGKTGFGTVQVIHKVLTQGELDVEHPGALRQDVARSSTALLLYPTHRHDLHEKTESYERWLNEQMELCASGKKSIILTAAQAYRRLVAIHPFEGGNGRISRLMMDYVLERFGLPPAALGKDVLDAVFALNAKDKSTGEEFVRKVYQGVQTSHNMMGR